tara:strand:- start:904 stop:1545 length:642 start_codon:yes stop_codon:yes gene_type:complete
MKLKVNEIFYSIQGESTYSGKPCLFIRLTGCNLRCTYCDTEYAFYDGKKMSIDSILKKIKEWNCSLVEVTGGEPLAQKGTIELLKTLLNNNYKVMLETSGSIPLKNVPYNVIKIVDFKCPSSGMKDHNLWSIIGDLNNNDEIKFVIGSHEDFKWAQNKIDQLCLTSKFSVIFSPVFNKIKLHTLATWILKTNLDVRLQTQLHKHIWDPNIKGV